MLDKNTPTSFYLSHWIYLAWYLPIWAEVCRGLNTTAVLPFLRRLSPCCGKELLSAIWYCPWPRSCPWTVMLSLCRGTAKDKYQLFYQTPQAAACCDAATGMWWGVCLARGLTRRERGCRRVTQGSPVLRPRVLHAVPGWNKGEITAQLQTHEGVMNLMLSAGSLRHTNRF